MSIRTEYKNCNKCYGSFPARDLYDGLCAACARDYGTTMPAASDHAQQRAAPGDIGRRRSVRLRAADVVMTTEPTLAQPYERMGVVVGEAVVGMHLGRDILASFRDIFGGRSATVEKALGQAREAATDDMRRKAAELGADTVLAIDFNYHSIGGSGGTNMMIVAVTGTAVRITTNGS